MTNIAICYVCKKSGTYIPHENKRDRKRNADEENIESELDKCYNPNCFHFYHMSCLDRTTLKFVDANQQRFRCPLHYCSKCGKIKDLIQCFRCTTTYHHRCLPKEKIVKLSNKFMICNVLFTCYTYI